MSSIPFAVALVDLPAQTSQPTAGGAELFWLIVLVAFAVVIGGVIWNLQRKIPRTEYGGDELRQAAAVTLGTMGEMTGTVGAMLEVQDPRDQVLQEKWIRALELRHRAEDEFVRGDSAVALLRSNADAAHAVVLLERIRQTLRPDPSTSGPGDQPRCLYCAHDDQPPYTHEVLRDQEENELAFDVCSVCRETLARGRTPQLARSLVDGLGLPWYAAPNEQDYARYAGAAWQHWLPVIVGQDAEEWFAAEPPRP